MPHLIIEYSANATPDVDIQGLVDTLHETAASIEAFPLAGLRTRAQQRDAYRIADGHADNAFVHVLLKIGHGRPLDVRQQAGEKIFSALENYLEPVLKQRPLAVSFEIQELDPVLNYKGGNIREYLAKRTGQSQ